ncbi:conserved hypothetical protein [uncultured Defluviicoccus sp.]|uniref:Nucleotidyltransferase family protein n=1 Tax=metagenome TaxID=256318 RepID=A0A380TK02_9ZZZZ|nr:conserved hypothetical protein [uncultured Defluviicoccus sp.]
MGFTSDRAIAAGTGPMTHKSTGNADRGLELPTERSTSLEILLSCARPGQERTSALSAAGSDVDWDYLLRLANRHKLVPVLSDAARRRRIAELPQPMRTTLRQHAEGNAQRNALLADELLRVLGLLAENEIRAFPMKGPAFATALHGSLTLRQFSDLDLLVAPEDAARARAVLEAGGFRDRNQRPTAFYRHFDLVSSDGLVQIDLQWALANKGSGVRLVLDELWQRRQTSQMLNKPVPLFGWEDMLQLLSYYCGKEMPFVYLTYLSDIAALIEKQPDLDWQEVLEQAQRRRILRVVLFALVLADALWPLSLPETVRGAIEADKALPHLVDRAQRRMFVEVNGKIGRNPTFAEKALLHPRLREHLIDGLRPLLFAPIFADGMQPVRTAGKRVLRLLRAS